MPITLTPAITLPRCAHYFCTCSLPRCPNIWLVFVCLSFGFAKGPAQVTAVIQLADAESDAPIPFAHVYDCLNPGQGTSSNIDGAFRWAFDKGRAMDTLCISHLSYQELRISLGDLRRSDTIKLYRVQLGLDEVTVTTLSSRSIVDEMINNLKANHDIRSKVFEFYSRVIEYDAGADSSLISIREFVGEVVINRNQSMSHHIGASRIYRKDQDQMSRWMTTLYKMNSDNPLRWTNPCLLKRASKKYIYRVVDEVTIDGRLCYEVMYKAMKADKNYYAFGHLYIDKATFGLMRITIEKKTGELMERLDFTVVAGLHVPFRSFGYHTNIMSTELFVLYSPKAQPSVDRSKFTIGINAHKLETFAELSSDAIDEFCQTRTCPPLPKWILPRL